MEMLIKIKFLNNVQRFFNLWIKKSPYNRFRGTIIYYLYNIRIESEENDGFVFIIFFKLSGVLFD